MMEFLLHPQNAIFSFALSFMLVIAILEGIMSILGMGVSSILSTLLPSFDVDLGVDNPNFSLSKFFNWIRIKSVPILMLMVIFLTSFGTVGLSIQAFLLNNTGTLLNQWFDQKFARTNSCR